MCWTKNVLFVVIHIWAVCVCVMRAFMFTLLLYIHIKSISDQQTLSTRHQGTSLKLLSQIIIISKTNLFLFTFKLLISETETISSGTCNYADGWRLWRRRDVNIECRVCVSWCSFFISFAHMCNCSVLDLLIFFSRIFLSGFCIYEAYIFASSLMRETCNTEAVLLKNIRSGVNFSLIYQAKLMETSNKKIKWKFLSQKNEC